MERSGRRIGWSCFVTAAACALAASCAVEGSGTSSGEAATPSAWRHLELADIPVDLSRLVAVRGRYLQEMYDLEGRGEVESRTIVHLDVDRALHSGPWDGAIPARLDPFQEPGLVVSWEIQHGLYNAFDRVLTGRHLGEIHRVLPAGTVGLRVGTAADGEYVIIQAVPPTAGEAVRVRRDSLAGPTVNVLTLPYLLALMPLRAGDRFTIPGHAIFGGPDGHGIAWRGAVRVVSERSVRLDDRQLPVFEILFQRMDERNGLTLEDVERGAPGQRRTRMLVSPEPPYFLGRADLVVEEDGGETFVREHLGIVDWAEQPLPPGEFADPARWDVDLERGAFTLRKEDVPSIRLPLGRQAAHP